MAKKKTHCLIPDTTGRILALRRQMLIHSYLYYWTDNPVISDYDWQKRANELAELQKQHGEQHGFYDAAFSQWTGDTGIHLPKDSWVINKASQIERICKSI